MRRCNKPATRYSVGVYFRACEDHYIENRERYPRISWNRITPGQSIRQDGTNPCDEPMIVSLLDRVRTDINA